MPQITVPLDGDNVLAAALRSGMREAAAEHQSEHPQSVEACEGCGIVEAVATLTTTQAEDDARFSRSRRP